MSPELTEQQWHRVDELFSSAIELPVNEQAAFLQGAAADDAPLRQHLLEMLRHSGGAADQISSVIAGIVQESAPFEGWVGKQLGPWRIVREIGRGGMGIVFEAVRNDDEYSKTVALKVAPAWRDLNLLRDRFRHERQILASLEHPNIARLLEGGTDHDTPWFAMEYVDGVAITTYCRDAGLTLCERLGIFRRVCEAVHYAHQHMVVHRDLKPSNILVDRTNTPKLLDFGIARLLTPEREGGGSTTATIWWTPDYTSPEQILGRNITMQTDVYSLGLILYELLSGVRAQVADTSSPGALERSICEVEAKLPSSAASATGNSGSGNGALSSQLRGDLDKIVSKAIHKDPEGRYNSCLEFSEDIGRYLEGRPVLANPGSWSYRTGKLIGRHRSLFIACSLMLAIAIAGLTSTLYQAHRAQVRFQQVRKLANIFVFDVHDQIAPLPGSTKARKVIVSTALEYLKNLREDAGGDTGLLLELADTYQRIGSVQGDPEEANLGDTAGAIQSFEAEQQILQELHRKGEPGAELRLADSHLHLALVRRVVGQNAASLKDLTRAEELVLGAARRSPRDKRVLTLAVQIFSTSTRLADEMRDPKRMMTVAGLAVEFGRRLMEVDPTAGREAVASAYRSLGDAHLFSGDAAGAAEGYGQAVAIREQLARENPGNRTMQRTLMIAYGRLGEMLGGQSGTNTGDFAGSAQALEKATAIAEWLHGVDPADRTAAADVGSAKLRLASAYMEIPGRNPDGVRVFREALATFAGLVEAEKANTKHRYNMAVVEVRLGEALVLLGRSAEARPYLEAARTWAGPTFSSGLLVRGVHLTSTLALGELLVTEDRERSARLASEAAAEIEKAALSPVSHAAKLARLGKLFAVLRDREASIRWLTAAAKAWRGLTLAPALESKRTAEVASIQALLQRQQTPGIR